MVGTRHSSSLHLPSAIGPPSSSLPTSSSTAASSWSSGTARLIRPTSAAREAGMRSPVRKSSVASAGRILGRQTTEMMAGATPMRTSVKPMVAEAAAIDRSHDAASPRPPASAWPLMRPTTGLGDSFTRIISAGRPGVGGGASPPPTGARCSFRSAPAQNVLPEPVSTMTRAAGSSSAASMWAHRLVTSSRDSALRLSGRFSVMRATPPAMVSVVAVSSTTTT